MTEIATTSPVHVFFLLDRSGSMSQIESDVIGGFNSFVDDQRREAGECQLTLIQFDSHDTHEVVFDAVPIGEVGPLDQSTFVPRGSTPLYDAMGHAIADATIRAEKRRNAGAPAEEILFVTFTDGLENSSREYGRDKVFALIRKREESGWTFAYLGANQDAYEEGAGIGVSLGSTQNFIADTRGTRLAFRSTSSSLRRMRQSVRSGQRLDQQRFYEGMKEADADARERGAGSSDGDAES